MIRSMTGYGAARVEEGPLRVAVTIRALNHRFLDLVCRLPRSLASLEASLRERVQARLSRGRVEITVDAVSAGLASGTVLASRGLAESLVRALRELRTDLCLAGEVSISDLARFPGVLEVMDAPQEPDQAARQRVVETVDRALDLVVEMQRAEGERLCSDLQSRLAAIEQCLVEIERSSTESREVRREALLARVQELVGEAGLEQARLYQEVVRAVERHDVAEEIQRLGSHVVAARNLLDGEPVPAGKRLDFLAQELMREANTLGSKVADTRTLQAVVELKAEIERFREQVQNVE
jgi:uncharacterized protein (TIGR00255 family)